jgi:multiple sugar transport system permease protein
VSWVAARPWPAWYRRAYPWFFVGPALATTLALTAAPLLQLFEASARDWQLGEPLSEAEWVGTGNFARVLGGSGDLGHSLRLSLTYTAAALAVELLLGLGIALLLERTLKGMSFLMSVLLVPMILMPAMVAMVWRLYFSFDGLVNWMIGVVGIPPVNWSSPAFALSAVVVVDVWQWTPFFALILLAGLQALPREVLEAAAVDRAGPWQQITRVQVPLLAPLIIIASTLRVMELIRQFDLVFVMFGGGPGNATETLPLAVFSTTVTKQQAGVGAALSILLIVFVMLVAWMFIVLMRRYRTAA